MLNARNRFYPTTQQNIWPDVFFSRKQKKGETIEKYYNTLRELDKNCTFKNGEEDIIRDIFITNMLDDNLKRELLRDTLEQENALSALRSKGKWDIKTNTIFALRIQAA